MRREERLVFGPTLEALFVRGLVGRLSVEDVEALRAAGVDLSKPLLPAYPLEVFRAAVDLAARRAFAAEPIARAYFLLGERAVTGMEETFLGRAQVAMAKVLGPLRTLQRLERNFRSGSNHTELTVTTLSPTSMEMTVTGYGLPYAEFQQGSLYGVLRITGAKGGEVRILSFDAAAETVKLALSWS